MKESVVINQDERLLATLSHGSIVLGALTNGIGGIVTALVIWLTQREKSDYVSFQSLQALVYQSVAFLLSLMAFFCWGLLWLLMFLLPVIASPSAYESAPPPGLWAGLALLTCPVGIMLAVVLYGLWGAFRCLGGHDFKYAIIGNWLERGL